MYFHSAADDIPATPLAAGSHPSPLEIWSHLYSLAWQGAGHVRSNPLVAAALIDANGRFVASAAHLRWGEAHAEASLLDAVYKEHGPEILAGSQLFSTLEPCSFHGKTPSCAKTIAATTIGAVYFAEKDPNPQGGLEGQKLLQEAGIICEHTPQTDLPMSKLTERFARGLIHDRPFVGLKAAITLDGIMATNISKKNNITSSRSRRYGHWLRRVYDAIVVGADTVLLDNPILSARDDRPETSVPMRIVLDPHGRALEKWLSGGSCHLISSHPERTIWVSTPDTWLVNNKNCCEKLKDLGVATWSIAAATEKAQTGFDLDALLSRMRSQEMTSVLLEGGKSVWSSFLQQQLVDRIHLCINMRLWGQVANHHWTAKLGLEDQPIELENMHAYPLANELLLEATPVVKQVC